MRKIVQMQNEATRGSFALKCVCDVFGDGVMVRLPISCVRVLSRVTRILDDPLLLRACVCGVSSSTTRVPRSSGGQASSSARAALGASMSSSASAASTSARRRRSSSGRKLAFVSVRQRCHSARARECAEARARTALGAGRRARLCTGRGRCIYARESSSSGGGGACGGSAAYIVELERFILQQRA